MSKYGLISGPYFPAFGKYGPEITPYLDTFHAVIGTTKKKDAGKVAGTRKGSRNPGEKQDFPFFVKTYGTLSM